MCFHKLGILITFACMAMQEVSPSTASGKIQLTPHWKGFLEPEFDKPYMKSLKRFLVEEKQRGKTIFPRGDEIFAALNCTAPKDTKVVIVGQDPYHGPGQAHGLCFSVRPGVDIPPSLLNIYKEMKRDLGITQPAHGFLQSWADQGVLLLNSTLTVEKGMAGSHQGKGWEEFTDQILRVLDASDEPMVFLLWGSYAQKKGSFLSHKKHLVLKAPHPSPLSAHRGFIGCGHFSLTNDYLNKNNRKPINWLLPPLT